MTPSSGWVSGVLQLSQVRSLSSNLKGSVELQISSATNANFCQLDLKCTAVVSVTSVHVANASGYTRQLYINQDDFTRNNKKIEKAIIIHRTMLIFCFSSNHVDIQKCRSPSFSFCLETLVFFSNQQPQQQKTKIKCLGEDTCRRKPRKRRKRHGLRI